MIKNNFKFPALFASACIVCFVAVFRVLGVKYFYKEPFDYLETFVFYWVYAIAPYLLFVFLYSIAAIKWETIFIVFFVFHSVVAFLIFDTVFARESDWIWVLHWPACALLCVVVLVIKLVITLFKNEK